MCFKCPLSTFNIPFIFSILLIKLILVIVFKCHVLARHNPTNHIDFRPTSGLLFPRCAGSVFFFISLASLKAVQILASYCN